MSKKRIKENVKVIDVNKQIAIIDSERTQDSISWYLTAKEDLLTAEVLLNNQRIAHCVFFLQQSIECIIKGIIIENNLVNNVRDFSHRPEEAFEQFYVQHNSDNIEICSYIKNAMSNISDFESRLIRMADIEKYYTFYYIHSIQNCPVDFEAEPQSLQAMGLKKMCSKEDIYNLVQKRFYVNTLIYLFAILFSPTQQNSRYPIREYDMIVPNEKYINNKKTIEGLFSIIECYNYILNEVFKD